MPRAILSDNGPPFSAVPLQRIAEVYGIHLLYYTPYHPRGNSIVESYEKSGYSSTFSACCRRATLG